MHLRKPVMCRLSQTYALVRSDLDTLLMPLLRQLYDATRRAPSHMYMLLVIVLILSQDTAFAAAVHKVPARPCTHCPCARECAWTSFFPGRARTHSAVQIAEDQAGVPDYQPRMTDASGSRSS